MSTKTSVESTNQSTPSSADFRMNCVTPLLVCDGAAKAIDFYVKAFGARELRRLAAKDGKLIHASLRLGDSMIMLVDEIPEMGCFGPKTLKGSPVTIHLQVEDADALQQRAVSAGATLIQPVSEAFWGDRYGIVADPFGHQWSMGTHVRDVANEDLQKAALEMCG
jgi:PhnB protein